MRASALALAVSLIAAMAPLANEKSKSADLDAWIGTWTAGPEQTIEVSIRDGGLALTGEATYGATDPERVERGAVNMGEFDVVVPAGWVRQGRLGFAVGMDGASPADDAEEYDCVVRLHLIGEVLEVEDNMMCGGMNVTFTGAYGRGR